MEKFLKRIQETPSILSHLIGSERHKYVSFLVGAHDPNFVLVIAEWFNLVTRHFKDAYGYGVIHLNSEYFNSVYKGSYTEEVVDINQGRAQKWYEENDNKCKKTINNVFLSSS